MELHSCYLDVRKRDERDDETGVTNVMSVTT